MEREELERKIKEKEEEFAKNGIPYGQWQLDNEYREMQDRIIFLDSVSMGQDQRSSDDLFYRATQQHEQISEPSEEQSDIRELEDRISEIDKLISQRETELTSEGMSYGDWAMDAKYQDLINKKSELEDKKEQVLAQIEAYKEELEEVERRLREKEEELERNGIPYGEWQLYEDWVELKNREEELNDLISKGKVKDSEPPKAPEPPSEPEPPQGPVPPVEPEPPKAPEPPSEPEPPQGPVPPVEPEPPKAPEPPKGPTETGEPENKEEKNSPIKVTAKKAWKWVKEHKKQILIAIGLTAVAVSMVVAINQLIPALMAAQKASQVSTIASSMINNANLWHLSAATEQAALHGANTGLSSLITSLTGQSAVFDATVGSWSIGGSSLSAFAADAASKAAIASAQVAKISSTALGLGVGGIGLTGIGALISNKNKSEKYNEYNNELKQIKEKAKEVESEEDLVNVYPHLYIVIEKVEKDTELSNDERKILLEKSSKIASKLSKKQSKFSKRRPSEFDEYDDEMILAEEENTRGGR